MTNIITWLATNWPALLAGLWALDQVLVTILGHTTLLDSITNILKSLGAGGSNPQVKK